jgi:hypothetical protein
MNTLFDDWQRSKLLYLHIDLKDNFISPFNIILINLFEYMLSLTNLGIGIEAHTSLKSN